jgi:hypothetical protein
MTKFLTFALVCAAAVAICALRAAPQAALSHSRGIGADGGKAAAGFARLDCTGRGADSREVGERLLLRADRLGGWSWPAPCVQTVGLRNPKKGHEGQHRAEEGEKRQRG